MKLTFFLYANKSHLIKSHTRKLTHKNHVNWTNIILAHFNHRQIFFAHIWGRILGVTTSKIALIDRTAIIQVPKNPTLMRHATIGPMNGPLFALGGSPNSELIAHLFPRVFRPRSHCWERLSLFFWPHLAYLLAPSHGESVAVLKTLKAVVYLQR